MKSIFIDTDRMGRTVHFCTDVIFHPCKCLNQTRFCLHPGLMDIVSMLSDAIACEACLQTFEAVYYRIRTYAQCVQKYTMLNRVRPSVSE